MTAKLDSKTFEKLKLVSTATISTQLFKRGFRQQFLVGVRPLQGAVKTFCGEAFTLRFIPSREDKDWDLRDLRKMDDDNIQWVAVESLERGQVLMVDSQNDPRAASAGNMLLTRLMKRGAAAAVTDGAFRDGNEISQLEIPAYCRENVATTRPAYHRAIEMQVPIGCAGVAVYPGDIVVGDVDGVIVIPRDIAMDVASDSLEQELLERFLLTKIQAGSPLQGTYPPNEQTLAEYEKWRQNEHAH